MQPARLLLLPVLTTVAVCSLIFPQYAAAQDNPAALRDCRVYVGTYTREANQGIYACEFDTVSGELGPPRVAAAVSDTGITNPSFLAIHPSGKFLYAVSEVADYQQSGGGAVAAFAIERNDGQLTLLNHQPSAGAGPCYVAVDREGRNALAANYGGGSAAVLPIQADGKLAPPSDHVQHQGRSVNDRRQEGPHAHSINVSPDNRFALVADLGLDKIVSYRLQVDAGQLDPHDTGTVATPPGSGPRHLTFHPNGRWAYANGELTNIVMAFNYDEADGSLQPIQDLTTLPSNFAGENTTAEVQVHPNGEFVYVSNRGHDSIAIFAIDLQDGRLTPLGQHPTGGRTPRNFGIDPSGRWLLAANQDSGTVTVHRILDDGRLESTGSQVTIPAPVCVKFLQP